MALLEMIHIERRINGVIVRTGTFTSNVGADGRVARWTEWGDLSAHFPTSERHAAPAAWWPEGAPSPEIVTEITGEADAEIFDARFQCSVATTSAEAAALPRLAPVRIIVRREQTPALAQALANTVKA